MLGSGSGIGVTMAEVNQPPAPPAEWSEALTGAHRPGTGATAARHGFAPLPHRGPAVSNALIDRLRDDEGG